MPMGTWRKARIDLTGLVVEREIRFILASRKSPLGKNAIEVRSAWIATPEVIKNPVLAEVNSTSRLNKSGAHYLLALPKRRNDRGRL